jgi:hypothetical protein
MNINSITAKDYRKKDDFVVRINKANSKPISEKPKMNVNLYVIKDYEEKCGYGLQKNKPKQTQFHLLNFHLKIRILFNISRTGIVCCDFNIIINEIIKKICRINKGV